MNGHTDLPAQIRFTWDTNDDDAVERLESAPVKKTAKSKPMKKKSAKAASKTKKKSASKSPKASGRMKTKKKNTTKKKAVAKKSNKAAPAIVAPKKATKKKKAKAAGAPKSTAATKVADVAPAATSLGFQVAAGVEYIDMKWGARLPKIGFGFWKVDQDKTAEVCRSAIEVGYRHLDCACDYGNEAEVGQGISKAISEGLCDRDDLWVTSKLWNTYHEPQRVRQACERSMKDLGVDYLDLYLVHFPLAQRFVPFEKRYPPGWFFDPNAPEPAVEEARVPMMDTWQAMEDLAKSGLVRNIGICNFGTSQLRDLLSYAIIRPSVLQVETHPYLTQEKLLRYCQQEKIAYTAFSPLGAQSYFSLGMANPSEAVMQHKVLNNIASEIDRTAAQVLLRWGVQRGTAVIPKTSNRKRMVENIGIFDFELTEKQMKAISALDKGRRFNDPGDFGEAAFNTFLPIYE